MTRDEFEEKVKEEINFLMDYAEEINYERDNDEFIEDDEWSGIIKVSYIGKNKIWEVPVRAEKDEVVIPTYDTNSIDFTAENFYMYLFFEAESEIWKAENEVEKLRKRLENETQQG
jgi:hypothetical protein